MATPVSFRRTRFVCISDTHNQTPKLPQGDVLIHAGDMTNQGSYTELKKTVRWLESSNFEQKIIIAGNHDVTLDKPWFLQNHQRFRYDTPQDPDACLELLADAPSITYLAHQSATVRLVAPDGPRTVFKIFGSPYSPALGDWAFGYDGDLAAADIWSSIPLDTDVVVTHTPPKGYCDRTPLLPHDGCEALRRALWSVRPKLAVCGHRHFGRGVERVRWRLDQPYGDYEGIQSEPWVDTGSGAGNKKESHVDLSSRSLRPLQNADAPDSGKTPNGSLQAEAVTPATPATPATRYRSFSSDGYRNAAEELPRNGPDEPAVRGRLGRLETCVVNASYMATNYGAHKQFNKPIVVDLDLPLWQGADEAPS